MKLCLTALALLTLCGCGKGFNDEFTADECAAFAAQHLTLGNVSDSLDAEDKAVILERTVRECRERTLGLSREEYACAMKAGSREEWNACGIVLKG